MQAQTTPRRERDVSPIGTSRFERHIHHISPDRSNAIPTTITTPTYPSEPLLSSLAPMQFHRPSRTTSATTATATSDSYSSHDHNTMDTYPTSVGDDERGRTTRKDSMEPPMSPVCVVSPDDWFARFHSDDDLAFQTDDCPDRATLAAVADLPLYDAQGESRTFGSLYDPHTATHQRQLIIFVRHFYCGACQAYLQALTTHISLHEYFTMPVPTSILVIGCGQPDLLSHYKVFTGCPYPMFADPSRSLFRKLGMATTLKIGHDRPEYMREIGAAAWAAGQVKTIRRSLKDPEGIRRRDVFRGGNMMQIGGEFLFEEGRVTWCHRMRHYRNHTEIKVLRRLLELDE